jgi:hypothetical protein
VPPKPEVTITLSCCPRCGWPNDETERSPVAPATKAPLAQAPAIPSKLDAPGKEPKIDMMVGRRWMASDFGMTEAEFKKHFTPTLLADALRYLFCERLEHKHATAEEEAKCIMDQIAAENAKPARDPGAPSMLDDCVMLKHTHGPDGKLVCALLQASKSKEHMAWIKKQPWNQEPQPERQPAPPAADPPPKRPRGRPRKNAT